MCCQIPPYDDLRSGRPGPIDDNGFVSRAWASFVAGVVLLCLSLASVVWLAARLA